LALGQGRAAGRGDREPHVGGKLVPALLVETSLAETRLVQEHARCGIFKGGLPGDFVFRPLFSSAGMAESKKTRNQLARGRSWRSSTSTAACATWKWRQIPRSCGSSASRSASPAP